MKTAKTKMWRGVAGASALALLSAAGIAYANGELKPYVLAQQKSANGDEVLNQMKNALAAQGFEIAGEYSPYSGATIIAITSDELKQAAAKSEMGGFGAIQRVSVTTVGDTVQVAYTNPEYMANVYRMADDLSGVAGKLGAALGQGEAFGAKGLAPEKLRKYHYKALMPYFDDTYKLGEFASYEQAVEAVEKGLSGQGGGVSKVYRVDIPNKQETVFGVAMTKDCSGDKFIMDKIDFASTKSTPHLPYEVLVSGDKVVALHAKFRIAQSFPDLSMVGSNSFFSIMCAPDAIQAALTEMVTGEAKQQ